MPRIGRGHFLGGPNLYAKVFQVSRVELLVNPKDALIQIFFNPELVGDIAATKSRRLADASSGDCAALADRIRTGRAKYSDEVPELVTRASQPYTILHSVYIYIE